ncbi:MAG TPA: oxidative damage protection protein [Nitrospiria bacterium]|nr:oxidative damage protection protein [Nitrospiria bacterium]
METRQVKCVKCGQEKPAIAAPAYGGKLGEEIKAKICNDCWKEWMDQSVKVINELRLNLSNADHRKQLTNYMREFLNLPAGG